MPGGSFLVRTVNSVGICNSQPASRPVHHPLPHKVWRAGCRHFVGRNADQVDRAMQAHHERIAATKARAADIDAGRKKTDRSHQGRLLLAGQSRPRWNNVADGGKGVALMPPLCGQSSYRCELPTAFSSRHLGA
eukprot:SAG31_NODE_1845_length_7104_cov_2.447680_6_plen_134_part_00